MPSDPGDTNSEQPPPKKLGERDCKSDKVCEVPHDHSLEFCDWRHVMDIYTMELTRNKLVKPEDFSFKGKLSGVIRNYDLRTGDFIYLYKVKPEDATVYLDFNRNDKYIFTLNGPQGRNQRLVDHGCTTGLDFALLLDKQSVCPLDSLEFALEYGQEVFGEAKVGFSELDFNPMCPDQPPFYNEPFHRVVPAWEIPIDITVRCAIMDPGAVARITIQILNKPANVRSIFGSISARPCSFAHRIPLISEDESALLNADSTIQLKRCLLAVPLHASLVIEVGPLKDQDGKDLIPYLGAAFVPSIDGSEVRSIKDEGGDERLEVRVKWQNPVF